MLLLLELVLRLEITPPNASQQSHCCCNSDGGGDVCTFLSTTKTGFFLCTRALARIRSCDHAPTHIPHSVCLCLCTRAISPNPPPKPKSHTHTSRAFVRAYLPKASRARALTIRCTNSGIYERKQTSVYHTSRNASLVSRGCGVYVFLCAVRCRAPAKILC